MSNEENTKKKLTVGLFDYLFLFLLLIGVITVSVIAFNNISHSQPSPSTPETYTVEFDVNIKDAQIESLKVNEGGLVTKPADPSKEGYTFGGWYRDEACEYKWDFSKDKVTGNTTLYPKWTINTYTVSFNLNDHGSKVDSQTIEYNGLVTKPTDPTAEGYTFGGWYKEKACENAWNFKENKITADATLYAKWTANPLPTFTVTFDLKGHGAAVESQTIAAGGVVTKPADPTESGYTFNGWYKDEDCEFKWDFANNSITANTTLYAKWTIGTYVITYELNGGSNPYSNPSSYSPASSTIVLTDPSKAGYTFTGWTTETVTTPTKNLEITSGSSGDITATAHWELNNYKVTFYLCGEDEAWYNEEPWYRKATTAHYGELITRADPENHKSWRYVAAWYLEPWYETQWNFEVNTITGDLTLFARWDGIEPK